VHHHHELAGHFLKEFDLNRDGKVTRAEFDQANAERFKKMDINGDGVITPDELALAHPDTDASPPPPPPPAL
jgi:Ca2+-binding EF-hand superfamily protein